MIQMFSLGVNTLVSQNGLPLATPLHRFSSAIWEIVQAIVTLGIGWLDLFGQILTPARHILGPRNVNAITMQTISRSQVSLKGFVLYFMASSALSVVLSLRLFGAGKVLTIVFPLLVLRSSHQTLLNQITGTTVGFQKKRFIW
jgi:hypothetical protein